jgi:ribosomal protein S18 acetylase RimI-like enzyme
VYRLTQHVTIHRRPVEEADQPFLYELYASTRAEELAVTGWSPEQKAAFLRMQFDAQTAHYRTRYAGSEFSIVEADGVPAGRLYVARWANEIRIVDIALVPRFRNRGIGTQLIGEVLAEGRESGKPVTIHVETFNPALRLYQRLGFRAKEDKGVYLLLEWSLDHQAGR